MDVLGPVELEGGPLPSEGGPEDGDGTGPDTTNAADRTGADNGVRLLRELLPACAAARCVPGVVEEFYQILSDIPPGGKRMRL